jgi:TolB protein
MKNLCTCLLLLGFSLRISAAGIGEFTTAVDVGNPKLKGSSTYDETTQTYTLQGGGYNIWFNHDEFHFLSRRIKGDFLLTANFQLIGNETGNGHRKTGWMIRENTDHDAVSVNSCLHGDGLAVLQWRLMHGAYMRDPEEEIFFPKPYLGENIVELERIGKTVTMRIAHPLEPFEDMGSVTLPDLKDEVLVGPYVLAHDTNNVQEARVWNVRISTPAAPDWHPNRLVKTAAHEGLVYGNKLESVEVATGRRMVLYEGVEAIGLRSFTPDGAAALFEKSGGTFSVSVSGGEVKRADSTVATNGIRGGREYDYYADNKTGTSQLWRKRKNGSEPEQLTFDLDHAWFPQLSPDGKGLAYLSFPHTANPKKPGTLLRVSLKVLPLAGGAPRTIARFFGGAGGLEPSCWSPDGSKIIFVSQAERR